MGGEINKKTERERETEILYRLSTLMVVEDKRLLCMLVPGKHIRCRHHHIDKYKHPEDRLDGSGKMVAGTRF